MNRWSRQITNLIRLEWAFVLVAATSVIGVRVAIADVANARELAGRELRYDDAEAAYKEQLQTGSAADRAIVAAEMAGFYEQIGDIDAAIQMYEQALAEGQFEVPVRNRLDVRLQRCRRERASLIQFPVSVEAQSEIRQVEAMVGAAQWGVALQKIGGILEQFEGTFLGQGPGQYLGVWQWARLQLREWPEEGQAYCIKWAQHQWQEALTDGSIAAFSDLICSHPSDATVNSSILAWADTLADRGKTRRALGLLTRRDVESRAVAERQARWAQLLSSTGNDASEPGQREACPWSRGDVDSLVSGLERGAVITLESHVDPDEIGLAVGVGKLFVYRPFRVEAFELASGKWLWGYVPWLPIDRRDVRRETFYRPKRPKNKWSGAMDSPAITFSPAGVLVVEVYHRGDPEDVDSVVTCLDPNNGKVRWSLREDPVFDRLHVCSEPVYGGGTVLFAATSGGEFAEFWLVAVDADNGGLLWRKRIAAGATPTRCIGRGLLFAGRSGPTVKQDGETIYYATHMGAVVAVDRDLGEPLWAVSYPRIARFGPISTGPLPLLERRSEAMVLAGDVLVLMPRDVNALLVIDRATGRLRQTIRSFDLLSLIDASSDTVWVTTLSGQVRAYKLSDGTLRWAWQSSQGPAVRNGRNNVRTMKVGDSILVMDGSQITELNAASGQVQCEHTAAEAVEFLAMMSESTWVAVGAGHIRLLDVPTTATAVPPPPVMMAKRTEALSGEAWRHELFLPARDSMARLMRTRGSIALVMADLKGLALYSASEGYKRQWWRPFERDRGIWAVSAGGVKEGGDKSAEPGPGVVAVSDDRETLQLLDPMTGRTLASGTVEGVLPIAGLYAVRETALVAGASTIAGATRFAEEDTLKTVWRYDWSPSVFEAVFPEMPITFVLVQPAAGKPGQLVRVEPETGQLLESFVIAAPLPKKLGYLEEDHADRFPVQRLVYDQTQIQAKGNSVRVICNGTEMGLCASPIRLLDRVGDLLLVEITDYWGVIEMRTGRVTLLSPFEAADRTQSRSSPEHQLVEWLATNPRHDRIARFRFCYDADGLKYGRERLDPRAHWELTNREFLTDTQGCEIALGRMDPFWIDRLGEYAVVNGQGGVLVLRHSGEARSPKSTVGKSVLSLMAAEPVMPIAADGLVLDGDLSDWPAEDFHELTRERHFWPMLEEGFSGNDSEVPSKVTFQWAMGSEAIWLAVRVVDENALSDESASRTGQYRVDIRLSGRSPDGAVESPQWMPPVPVTIQMMQESGLTLAYADSPARPRLLATPVGMGTLFDAWLDRYYDGDPPLVTSEIASASGWIEGTATYELWIDRRFFVSDQPSGFDIRVSGEDGSWSLEWGGAVTDPQMCPLAAFVPRS